MIPAVFEYEILLFEIIQVIVAFIAVVLALKWKKSEFVAVLSFLLIYTILDLIDVFFFTITEGVYLDVAQFGFILLSILFFIIGMHNSWHGKPALSQEGPGRREKPSGSCSFFSTIRKI